MAQSGIKGQALRHWSFLHDQLVFLIDNKGVLFQIDLGLLTYHVIARALIISDLSFTQIDQLFYRFLVFRILILSIFINKVYY